MSEWQDIATAPRDGRRALVYSPEEGRPWFGVNIGTLDEDIVRVWICDDRFGINPTLWMPLPHP